LQLESGIKEQGTHQNYKNTKLHIARLNRETNKRKHKKKKNNKNSSVSMAPYCIVSEIFNVE